MEYIAMTMSDIIKFDRKPNEDFYLVSSAFPIYVIADGVTQAHFPSGEYAFPLGAKTAAEIFCFTVLENLEKNFLNKKIFKNPEKVLKDSFNIANKKIKKLNKTEGIYEKMDYYIYDLFDTVGIAGFILKNFIFYGYVGDCALKIFDKENKIKFETEDQVKSALFLAKSLYKDWEKLQEREKIIIMHKYFRNSLDRKGYGSFSGEEGVKKYYKIGKVFLEKGDLIVFHSDGFSEYFKFQEFLEILRKKDEKALRKFSFKMAISDPLKFGRDRTLVSFIF